MRMKMGKRVKFERKFREKGIKKWTIIMHNQIIRLKAAGIIQSDIFTTTTRSGTWVGAFN